MLRVLGFWSLLLLSRAVTAADCVLPAIDLLSQPQPEKGPVEVTLRVFVNDITDIKDVEQSFGADVYFRAEWLDQRLAHSGQASCSASQDDVWTPRLQLLNRRGVLTTQPDMMVAPDGQVFLALRAFARFSFHADLREFPFDTQQLGFNVIAGAGVDQAAFRTAPEFVALEDELSIANWRIALEGVNTGTEYIAPVDRTLPRLDILFRAQRLKGFYTWQQLVPLFLVVMMTWVVFWIPREHVAPRVGLASTSMLTLIAYRFAMSTVLPPIAYLTRLDVFMIGASVLVFGALATAVAVTYLGSRGLESVSVAINRTARWLSPLLLVLIAGFAFLL